MKQYFEDQKEPALLFLPQPTRSVRTMPQILRVQIWISKLRVVSPRVHKITQKHIYFWSQLVWGTSNILFASHWLDSQDCLVRQLQLGGGGRLSSHHLCWPLFAVISQQPPISYSISSFLLKKYRFRGTVRPPLSKACHSIMRLILDFLQFHFNTTVSNTSITLSESEGALFCWRSNKERVESSTHTHTK